jgi:thiamine biosynthesis protein ThiS
LVLELDLPVNKLAIEHNLIIVPKSLYGSTVINDDDLIEIVHFVGGG